LSAILENLFEGARLPHKTLLEHSGNYQRSLWLKSCDSILQSAIGPYQRAVIGILTGKSHCADEVCISWYDFLWASIMGLLQDKIEDAINSSVHNITEWQAIEEMNHKNDSTGKRKYSSLLELRNITPGVPSSLYDKEVKSSKLKKRELQDVLDDIKSRNSPITLSNEVKYNPFVTIQDLWIRNENGREALQFIYQFVAKSIHEEVQKDLFRLFHFFEAGNLTREKLHTLSFGVHMMIHMMPYHKKTQVEGDEIPLLVLYLGFMIRRLDNEPGFKDTFFNYSNFLPFEIRKKILCFFIAFLMDKNPADADDVMNDCLLMSDDKKLVDSKELIFQLENFFLELVEKEENRIEEMTKNDELLSHVILQIFHILVKNKYSLKEN